VSLRGVVTARWSIPAIGLCGLALVCLLYWLRPDDYQSLLTAWMLRPFSHPFIDWEWIPSAVKCWNQGVDVYTDNTCYAPIAHGRHMYSPLWLRATFLPLGQAWFAPFGLIFAALFYGSFALLPAPRGHRDFTVMLLAALSSCSVFAVERGNADLIMYLFMLAGAWLLAGRLAARLAGYALFTLAGLLKFYPMVLLLTALRERRGVFLAVFLASTASLLIFLHAYRAELAIALHNVAGGSFYTDMFGAVNLPLGAARLALRGLQRAGLHAANLELFMQGTLPAVLYLGLIADALRRGLGLANHGGLRAAIARLPARDAAFLVTGAAVVCGCFFMGQSVGYRSIFLIPALPGLRRLAALLPDARTARQLLRVSWAMAFVMWGLSIQYVLRLASGSATFDADASAAGIAHWLLHELAWWWIIGVLLAVVFGFIGQSTMFRAVFRRG